MALLLKIKVFNCLEYFYKLFAAYVPFYPCQADMKKISNFFHILPSRYNKKEMLQRLVRQFADFMTAITQRCLSWHLYSCTLSYKISNEIQNALHLITFISPCYQYYENASCVDPFDENLSQKRYRRISEMIPQ